MQRAIPSPRFLAVSSVALLLVLTEASLAQVDGSLLAGIKARSIGPAGMSGRVVALDAVVKDPNTIYAAG